MTILHDLNIPRSGSVENAKLLAWMVQEGAPFAAGELLYEIETDKVATEVEAVEAGVLVRHLAKEGDEHKVGDRVGLFAAPGTSEADIRAALAAFDGTGAAVPAATPAVAEPDAAEAPDASADASPDASINGAGPASGERLSPIVRRLAREQGVDLATVTGTGPGGRITAEDVTAAAAGPSAPAVPAGYASVAVDRVALTMRRKTIARRLTEAAAAPTLTADMEIDLTNLFALRQRLAAEGTAPSVLALVAEQVCALLMADAHRDLNATYTGEELLRWKTVNLGIAIDTDEGLIVPVIRDAQTLSAADLSARIADLAARGRTGALSARETEGGTFTLSNPGSLGPVRRAEAILNTPQVALLGLPGIVRVPLVVERGDGGFVIEARRVVRPSLTFDHRAMDAGTTIRFLNA